MDITVSTFMDTHTEPVEEILNGKVYYHIEPLFQAYVRWVLSSPVKIAPHEADSRVAFRKELQKWCDENYPHRLRSKPQWKIALRKLKEGIEA